MLMIRAVRNCVLLPSTLRSFSSRVEAKYFGIVPKGM